MQNKRLGDILVSKTRNKRKVPSNVFKLLPAVPNQRRQPLHGHLHAGHGIFRKIHSAEPAPAKLADKLILVDTPERCSPIWAHRHRIVHRILVHISLFKLINVQKIIREILSCISF